MKLDPSIFHSYDIRGVYDKDFDDKATERIARAFIKVGGFKKIILGRDGRVSGPKLHKILLDTFLNLGVDVIDIGLASTDMYYFACAEKGLPGIMITASHNPKEYNGFKMVKKIPYFFTGDDEIEKMKNMVADTSDEIMKDTKTKGKVEDWDLMEEFIEKMLSLVDVNKLRKMKVVADPGNGMAGPILKKIAKHLPMIEFVPMYWEVDGTFPNHGGDPLEEENRRELQKRVVSEKADLGVAFDTDGDRFFSIDSKGRFIHGDFFTAILSNYFLPKHPGANIVYDIRASWVVPETIEKLGGVGLYNRVGHSYIKARMKDENAVFGGEVTGHYYFKDFYLCDTGIGAMIYLLASLSESGKNLDEFMTSYSKKYYISGEINSSVPDVSKVLDKIEAKYGEKAKEVIKIDGVTCVFDDWKFNVRGSNTQPLIRLNLEAKTQKGMEEKRDEVLGMIRG